MSNPYDEPVVLERIERFRVPCGASKRTSFGVAQPQGRMGQARIEPGQSVRFDWTEPRKEGVCSLEEDVGGRGVESGQVASARWVMPLDPGLQQTLAAPQARRAITALRILPERRGTRGDSHLG